MILIDILENEYLTSTQFKRYFKPGDLKKKVNFIKYVIETYRINVTNLSKIFNVSRQSIYKYMKVPTSDLPKVLLDKIVYIYGCHTFDEVLKMELILTFKDKYRDEIENKIDRGIDFNHIKHPYKFLYTSNKSNNFDYISLKQKYQYEIYWERSLAGIRNIEYETIDVYSAYREFLSKHSSTYVTHVFKKLNHLDKDDYELIRMLDSYELQKRRKNALYR